ncbi:MAG: Uma2 family endonuclease [Leptolyngbyaceae cyanobacterium MO_188.B28]|nr:Uma2 family endonuclease [Leptolyngbyaceae cyanobacterium MO_188.B28]
MAVDLADAALKMVFGPSYYIRQQKPFVISDISEPEPDIAVIKGDIRDFTDAHPTEAELIVDVADSSLRYDRAIKGSLYAKAGIAEYWIVNLVDQQLEVYSEPGPDVDADYGFSYRLSNIFKSGQQVTPMCASQNSVANSVPVADILP